MAAVATVINKLLVRRAVVSRSAPDAGLTRNRATGLEFNHFSNVVRYPNRRYPRFRGRSRRRVALSVAQNRKLVAVPVPPPGWK